jgi:transmembrane sensor
MQEPSFREVFTKFLGESMTAEEIRLLCDYIRDSKNDPLLDELLETAYTNPSFSEAGDRNMEDALTEVLARLREREPGETAEAPAIHETPVISRHRIYWFRGIAAAAVIAGLIYGGIRLIGPGTARRQPLASAAKKVLLPGTKKAILTLANGTRIQLDEAANGTIAQEHGVSVIRLDSGALTYNNTHNADTTAAYNTITTPRGGEYQVTLSDGTKVWLNAASSLHFPTLFTGTERAVEMTGEAYFEVAPDKAHPFKVKAGNTEVKVLGTHFNIMAYDDAPEVETTLLQGSVVVSQGKEKVILTPGQQSVTGRDQSPIGIAYPNTEQEIAWKNGLFIFHNTDIKTVMKQLGRWYDADVAFKGNVNAQLTGIIPRNTSLLKVLTIFETTGEAHFSIDQKTITVLP